MLVKINLKGLWKAYTTEIEVYWWQYGLYSQARSVEFFGRGGTWSQEGGGTSPARGLLTTEVRHPPLEMKPCTYARTLSKDVFRLYYRAAASNS